MLLQIKKVGSIAYSNINRLLKKYHILSVISLPDKFGKEHEKYENKLETSIRDSGHQNRRVGCCKK